MKKFPTSSEGISLAAETVIAEIDKQKERYKIRGDISTIFVAGAPGAGKSEFIETVLNTQNFIVIDIDTYREYFEGYTGKNASVYQDCSSRVATKVFDYCMKHELKIIFDGTLTSEIGIKNIFKAQKKKRKIGIVLIYQDPVISYASTIGRQIQNTRNVSVDVFLRIYYKSIQYCFEIASKYPDIPFVIGSKTKQRKWNQLFIRKKDKFDKYFRVSYNEDKLREKLEQLCIQEGLLDNIKKIWKQK